MKYIYIIIIFIITIFYSCEEEFTPDIAAAEPEIVVEGYIESGENAFPPYVILRKSFSYFKEFSIDSLDNLYIHDAEILIKWNGGEMTLDEYCLNDLTPEQLFLISQLYEINIEDLPYNFCLYIGLQSGFIPEEGVKYNLEINTGGKELTSSTTIPEHTPLDTIFFKEVPGDKNDTLANMRAKIQSSLKAFYTFYNIDTKGNNVRGVPYSDYNLTNGEPFEFNIPRPQNPNEEFDRETFGLYHRGDTVTIKWMEITEEQFGYYNTLDYNTENQGPFSNYTQISTNISGGIGSWAGSSVSYYTVIIPEE